jgi:hypothetical protein
LISASLAAPAEADAAEGHAAVLARGRLEVGDVALYQELGGRHVALDRRLVAPGHATAGGEVLLLHRRVPHVGLAEHDEMARLLERVGEHGAPGVRELERAAVVGVVLELRDRDAEPQAAGGRVGGRSGRVGARDRG